MQNANDVNKESGDSKESQEDKLAKIRHSTAHVMAGAVLEIFPEAKFGIGPSIDNGFYYDFDLNRSLTPEDLARIEEKMSAVLSQKHEFMRKAVSREEARKLFKDQPYKLELIEELPEGEEISVYTHANFVDLCRGPHVASTNQLNAKSFKLLSIAGAYWRGSEKNKMLQRIYGTAWDNPKDLRLHLQKLEEIEKRDHRRLGKELDLYSIHEEAGPGFIYWHPKGARIRSIIEEFWRHEHYKNGYEMLYTPHLGKSWLWETSGHLGFYNENMYSPMTIDETNYYVKPMNCPFHILIYKTKSHSYRDLPLRWAELGTVYRYERSGVLHGLLRVRGFTQDDAHIFCTPEQIEDEILEVLRFSLRMWKYFGFSDIKAYLATRPLEKSVGADENWQQALTSLKKAVEKEGLEYEIDEGGGAFYGPKIDLKIKDALGREWQMTTIQFDFNEPERFDMKYVAQDGTEKRPYMVHRALLGSIERFFGVLTEHYAGAFPVWLAPQQVAVIPVAAAFNEYAEKVTEQLVAAGYRAKIDASDDRLNAKIRNAQTDKIPYTLVVGEKEQTEGKVAVRLRKSQENKTFSLDEFKQFLKAKVESKEEI
jgi:threonyl-tRNA synthetase